jgi:hypothetical protein
MEGNLQLLDKLVAFEDPMLNKKPSHQFWLLLGMLNILALVYPTNLYLGADNDLEQLLGIFVLIGAGLLLVIIDMVSILSAYTH